MQIKASEIRVGDSIGGYFVYSVFKEDGMISVEFEDDIGIDYHPNKIVTIDD